MPLSANDGHSPVSTYDPEDEQKEVFVDEQPPEAPLDFVDEEREQIRNVRRGLMILGITAFLSMMLFSGAMSDEKVSSLQVKFSVQNSLQAVLPDGRCDEVILTLSTNEYDVKRRDSFLLVRRLDNTPNAVQHLEALLQQETKVFRHNHKEDILQRLWIVDNLLQTTELLQILEKYSQDYTTNDLPRAYWAAPLVFPSETDVLHQPEAYANVNNGIATRTLTPTLLAQVYQHKIAVIQRASTPERVRGVLKNITTTSHLVQWGTFCPVTASFIQTVAEVAAASSPQSLPTSYNELVPTSPDGVPVTAAVELNQNTLLTMEKQVLKSMGGYHPQRLTFYNTEKMTLERQAYQEAVQQQNADPTTSSLVSTIQLLIQAAENATRVGPWSVLDKSDCSLLPSCQYYYSRSPYYWPSNDSSVPYVKRPGLRVPGSNVHDEASSRYDRTPWYDVHSNTTMLGLAWWYTGDDRYAAEAAQNIRTWFLDPNTRMEPTLLYSHVQYWDHIPDDYTGNREGHIDFVHVYYFMDVLRLICQSGQLTTSEQEALVEWFRRLFHDYLINSVPGTEGYLKHNNIGTYHDLVTMSVAAFVGDLDYLVTTVPWTANRLWEQVDATLGGGMPAELARNNCTHYQIYALEGWINIARVSLGIGYNLWGAKRDGIEPLCQAMEYVLSRGGACEGNVGDEDPRKLWALWMQSQAHCPGLTNPIDDSSVQTPYDLEDPHVVSAFWNLGLPGSLR